MPRLYSILMLSAAGLVGCQPSTPTAEQPVEVVEVIKETVVVAVPAETPVAEETPMVKAAKPEMPAEAPAAGAEKAASLDGDVKLNAKNTLIQFVGTHSGDKPDPRTGKFGELSGTATFAEGMPREMNVEIKTESLSTDIDKLTDHLKSPDFFNVREFPVATFKTTSIDKSEEGKYAVTGDLTLLGVTKSLTFPATVAGGKLKAEFKIDRTNFGMTYGDGKVEKEVAMTIEVSAN